MIVVARGTVVATEQRTVLWILTVSFMSLDPSSSGEGWRQAVAGPLRDPRAWFRFVLLAWVVIYIYTLPKMFQEHKIINKSKRSNKENHAIISQSFSFSCHLSPSSQWWFFFSLAIKTLADSKGLIKDASGPPVLHRAGKWRQHDFNLQLSVMQFDSAKQPGLLIRRPFASLLWSGSLLLAFSFIS